MKFVVLKVVGLVIILNFISYWLFLEIASEKIVNSKYIEFTELRLQNPYTVDTNEYVWVTSCGDEFFRNEQRILETIFKSNPKGNQIERSQYFSENEFIQTVNRIDDDVDVLRLIQTTTDTSKSSNCIIYKVCTQRTIPALLKRVEYQFFYSSKPTNFHIMHYNKQVYTAQPNYLWLFGFWIEINGTISNL